MKRNYFVLILSLVLFCFTFADNSLAATNINGTVTYNGSPVCTMVLANGQYQFTCSGDGSFNLDVPLDVNGQITVFAFCSGLAPFKEVIYPGEGQDMQIQMEADAGGTGMDIAYTVSEGVTNSSWMRLNGNITYNGSPVCAMALANGQYQFTCSGDGSFDLEVPLDSNGEVTLFGFCSGLPPYKEIFFYAGTVTSAGQVWLDRNLGASRVATSYNDSEAYGDLYQWGRGSDGHEKLNSPTTSAISSIDDPGHGSFITVSSSPYDWRSPQNDNLWQGESGINNPCPAGFRLPTDIELNTERASWSNNNSEGAFNSPLKLVAAGFRVRDIGAVIYVGLNGHYWSSTVDGSDSRALYFISDYANIDKYDRAVGFSVRCLED